MLELKPYTQTSAAVRIREFNEDNRWLSKRDVLLIRQLKQIGLNKVWVAHVLDVLEDICKHCWDNDFHCMCWNDE